MYVNDFDEVEEAEQIRQELENKKRKSKIALSDDFYTECF